MPATSLQVASSSAPASASHAAWDPTRPPEEPRNQTALEGGGTLGETGAVAALGTNRGRKYKGYGLSNLNKNPSKLDSRVLASPRQDVGISEGLRKRLGAIKSNPTPAVNRQLGFHREVQTCKRSVKSSKSVKAKNAQISIYLNQMYGKMQLRR